MGLTWGPSGAPYWSHEFCYLGVFPYVISCSFSHLMSLSHNAGPIYKLAKPYIFTSELITVVHRRQLASIENLKKIPCLITYVNGIIKAFVWYGVEFAGFSRIVHKVLITMNDTWVNQWWLSIQLRQYNAQEEPVYVYKKCRLSHIFISRYGFVPLLWPHTYDI